MQPRFLATVLLLLAAQITSAALAQATRRPNPVADTFVQALQQQRFDVAASLFAPSPGGDSTASELALRRLNDRIGGFTGMRPVATLPGGQTVKLEVPKHQSAAFATKRFVQLRYKSTAVDGQPVYYELNVVPDGNESYVLSFGVHLPVADEQSRSRAGRLATKMGN